MESVAFRGNSVTGATDSEEPIVRRGSHLQRTQTFAKPVELSSRPARTVRRQPSKDVEISVSSMCRASSSAQKVEGF